MRSVTNCCSCIGKTYRGLFSDKFIAAEPRSANFPSLEFPPDQWSGRQVVDFIQPPYALFGTQLMSIEENEILIVMVRRRVAVTRSFFPVAPAHDISLLTGQAAPTPTTAYTLGRGTTSLRDRPRRRHSHECSFDKHETKCMV